MRKAIVRIILCAVAFEPFLADAAFYRTSAASSPTLSMFRLSVQKESLKFQAEISLTSSPLESNSKEEIRAFFLDSAGRNHFLSAGGTSTISEVPRTVEIEQFWKDACVAHHGMEFLPADADAVVVTETVVQFPGLKLENSVFSGVKMVENGDFPAYQVILIAERKRVFGAPHLVWVFNKLTGHSAEMSEKYSPPSGKAKSYISILQNIDGYCVAFDCNVEVYVEFPKLLLKILPTTRDAMEEQGGESVKKAIEKDVTRGVTSANDAFLDWQKAASITAA